MNTSFKEFIYTWPKPYIRDQDLATIFYNDDNRRYDTVKYAINNSLLSKIKRGLYLINLPHKKNFVDQFEIAQIIHGPSYISLESALSYHGWIPERVEVCTSVTAKRSKNFTNAIANFSYSHTPIKSFMLEVSRLETADAIFLIAEPWKAIADHIYVRNRPWQSIGDMLSDLRIEQDLLPDDSHIQLESLIINYDSAKVRQTLEKFYTEIL